jgi:putative hemolysin
MIRSTPVKKKRDVLIKPIKKLGGVVGQKYLEYKSKQSPAGQFFQKVPIFIDSSRYSVRTVSNFEELRQSLRLRYKVFIREGLKKRKPIGLDTDTFDFIADHLVVEDKASGRIVGTYRLISSLFSSEYYSQSEFELDEFLKQPGIKLELGRACIEQEHRNGAVLTLLWKGIHEYMSLTNARFLFGCASIKTTDVEQISRIYHSLHAKGLVSLDYQIRPTPAFRISDLSGMASQPSVANEASVQGETEAIPSLLRSYFKAGARVMGEPALDVDFQCIDFLTILQKDLLDDSYSRKFSSR